MHITLALPARHHVVVQFIKCIITNIKYPFYQKCSLLEQILTELLCNKKKMQ